MPNRRLPVNRPSDFASPTVIDPQMDVFYGRVTESLAHLYVRLPRSGADDQRTISGSIRGPICAVSHTLPATVAIRDTGPGPTLLGAAIMPDPCCWSPRLPAHYEVRAEVRAGSRVVRRLEQTIGIRQLGVAGRNLRWEGKRWVLRGIAGPPAAAVESSLTAYVETCREVSAAISVVDPSEPICQAAAEAGVVIVARLTNPLDLVEQLAALARWSSVAFVCLPQGVTATSAQLRHAAPNLLLAQHCDDSRPVAPAEWANLVVCRVSEPRAFHGAVGSCPLPIVAERGLNEVVPVAAARAACDHLQRDLAPDGDYAGYLVTP